MNNLIDKEDSQKKFHEENPEYKEMYEQSKNSPLYKLRKKILHLRINKGLSQSQLAEMADTKQSVISRLENGTCEPKLSTVQKIAEALDKEMEINLK